MWQNYTLSVHYMQTVILFRIKRYEQHSCKINACTGGHGDHFGTKNSTSAIVTQVRVLDEVINSTISTIVRRRSTKHICIS